MNPPNYERLLPASQMEGDDDEDNQLLQESLAEATAYMQSLQPGRTVRERYVGLCIAGVVSVFLFRLQAAPDAAPDMDDWAWVVSGDVPSASFASAVASGPIEALEHYCTLMDGWIETIRSNAPVGDTPPLRGLTSEHATSLQDRVSFLRAEIIPNFRGT